MHTHVYMDMCVYKMFLFILFYGNVPSFIQNILYRFRRGHSVAETCRDDDTNKYPSTLNWNCGVELESYEMCK